MRSRTRTSRRYVAFAASGVVALSLAACGGEDPGDGDGGDGDGGTAADGGGSLVFGGAADPVILDGAYVSDGESIRVIRQIFEGLVTTEAGGTEIVPALATDWEASEDGLTWTFNLAPDVTFHDETPFDAEAVCFNFERWYNFTGILQSPSVSYYYQTVFGGFAENESPDLAESLYESCEAEDETTAVITLSRPSSTFLSGLSLPAFSMQSPTALEEYGANDVSGSGDTPTFDGTYGYEHPTGTGPFRFVEWGRDGSVELERNADYRGDPALLEQLIFQAVPDPVARRQALENGEIDGYDLVDPADVGSLESAGFQILRRPAFNVGYVGFNSSIPPLDDPLIRQAVAHAIDKDNIISTAYPEGAQPAIEFMPPELWGWTEDVPTYEYDPARAQELITESGADPTIEFWYPTDVTRPYLPDPEGVFELISADLEAAGFTVTPQSAPWNPDYLALNQTGDQQMYLLGWTGDFGDPDNFLGTFFQSPQPQWGFNDEAIFSILDEAEAEPEQDARQALYEEANALIMEFVPGVPFAHTQPAIALAEGISGYEPSPVNNEDFALVSVSE